MIRGGLMPLLDRDAYIHTDDAGAAVVAALGRRRAPTPSSTTSR
jgi:hypothetical protein